MFRPTAIVIDAFVENVLETYDRLYPHPDPMHRQVLLQVDGVRKGSFDPIAQFGSEFDVQAMG